MKRPQLTPARTSRSFAIGSMALGLTAAGLVATTPAQARPDATSWSNQGIRSGIKGVDVSRWQHGNTHELNFSKLRTAGVQFAIIQASNGYPRSDAIAAQWWAIDRPAAKRAGVVVGSYHFAYPTSKVPNIVADARGEARLAARRTSGFGRGHLATALDLESAPNNLTKSQLTRWATAWLNTYKRKSGRTPYLYSYTYFIETRLNPSSSLTRYPLWLADYGRGQSKPESVRGWPRRKTKLWQFTSSGKLPGSGSRTIDLDVYLGSTKSFRKRAQLTKRGARRYGL